MVFYPRRCSCDMPFVKEDPPHLSKSRLKSGLVDHNVELYLRHGDQKKAADFSSDDDDDDQIRDAADEDLEAAKMPDPSSLTDADLKAMLVKYGVKPGPIVASTRLLYERKLRKLLQSDGHDGAENNVWYSDSEEERERHEEEENKESVLEQEIIEVSESQQESTKVHQEPVGDILKDIFPNTQTSPTGIYATPRRPIKGAAQRPIQFSYPDTPVSPLTQERREVERRLVPVQIQIMVFFILMFVLYLIYVNVEHSSPVLALLESLNQRSDD